MSEVTEDEIKQALAKAAKGAQELFEMTKPTFNNPSDLRLDMSKKSPSNYQDIRVANNMLDNAEDQVESLQASLKEARLLMTGLFDEIKHGDDEHQKWLKEKLNQYFKQWLEKFNE